MRCSRLTLLLLFATPVTCYSCPAKVVVAADGDTITVLQNDQQKETRLYGIDCPEKSQDHEQQAKALTAALVVGSNTGVDERDMRMVGIANSDGR